MINAAALVADLKKQVLVLEDDIRGRLEQLPVIKADWQARHRRQVDADRTASAWTSWRDDQITQAAVAWVLTTVFVRFCEDNGLLSPVWIAGPPTRRQEALDAQLAYFREHPDDSDREWLDQATAHLAKRPATAGLVDEHSGLWLVSPSGQACSDLIAFWRQRTEDGALLYDFTDEQLTTRFLGDLYQDLSDHAKKTYALLQTPEFVEEFILDQTMDPALAERPLEGFRLIDPTCGSGHFLLGAFRRLLDRWDKAAPGMELQARVNLALKSVYGVDLNPFAVAIARFRLTVEALRACGLRSLEHAPHFDYHVYTGDSLLFGASDSPLPFDGADPDLLASQVSYSTEDAYELRSVLAPSRYDAVVGNPPYIPVKDPVLKREYKRRYLSCKANYALTVPFVERFFQLAVARTDNRPSGWVGMIASNSFMKREFGDRLVEEYLPRVRLVRVIDTEGAWIPGHNADGTPTVTIVGRNEPQDGRVIRVLTGKGLRETRATARVGGSAHWLRIVERVEEPGYEDDWITVGDRDPSELSRHPWILAGGAVPKLMSKLETGPRRLRDVTRDVGFMAVTREDDAYLRGGHVLQRLGIGEGSRRRFCAGGDLRDWRAIGGMDAICPYGSDGKPAIDDQARKALWPLKASLMNRRAQSGYQVDIGLHWWEYSQMNERRLLSQRVIAYAEVATHNHFVIRSDDSVYGRTAPCIALPDSMTDEEVQGLCGFLNSSLACFWLRQRCKPKGGAAGDVWRRTYQFNVSNVAEIPIPEDLPYSLARRIQELVLETRDLDPLMTSPLKLRSDASNKYSSSLAHMISLQEELDWYVYGVVGVFQSASMQMWCEFPPKILPGQRAFEIALARGVSKAGEIPTWFAEHGIVPHTELPSGWSPSYRALVERRIEMLGSDDLLGLLERPEYKRRWSTWDDWNSRYDQSLRDWILSELESRRFWFSEGSHPRPISIAQLADMVSREELLVRAICMLERRPDVSIVPFLSNLLTGEAVPFLAAYRMTEGGLRKSDSWREIVNSQMEDGDEFPRPAALPRPFEEQDFRSSIWWQARGKLDVPKERFILYPDAGRSTDSTLLLGWAGWDHAEQALALAMIIAEREEEGWTDERLIPLVAGLAELQPWVEQWHAEVDPTYGVSLAAFCREQLAERSRQVGRSPEQLADWRPKPATRGRRART
ncbi:hypothetical protein MLP_28620 [Microlunatus phosphovorus NM-1]|uniref:site-specific DNA-methyltransferase (adenine-specific) n=1 Tax=Microlunatus phosphovorus (strain ATCC 700054 / DSM 10555 / JCM 9379 / NBRC 101784 / NCIMB 13414 / VKM Ac-1990 / NM-1) TaxID=1032480 RepID=F5XJH6_MICPN|nr:BREX-2 system adenine-specific DNA-methyltransferase PglX [Microlunatus phosphovorus]BAK35876.1 hypothetical protein MLP_28620 [Microlunatus phosphovorus NM-1]